MDLTSFREIPFCPDYMVNRVGDVFSKRNSRLLSGRIDCYGYKQVNLNKKSFRVHRLVAITFIPNPEFKEDVNHINHNKLDNRVQNLRWVSHSENMMNKSVQKNNKLGLKGIYEEETHYRAQISKNKKQISKSFPKTEKGLEEAKTWRKEKEKELFGEFNFKNDHE